ncbi:MAG: hypothetical protein ACLP2F_09415 [Steroidobacteraceae bacterium]
MASDGNPGKLAVTSLVQPTQAAQSIGSQQLSGKPLPADGKNVPRAPARSGVTAKAATDAATAANPPAPRSTDPQSLVDLLNKYLNESGRPDLFRLAPNSGGKLIQQVNPATGEVIGEFPVSEFPALARSVGASSLLIDSLA